MQDFFSVYQQHCREILKAYWKHLTQEKLDEMLALNTPFELKPEQTTTEGALLIHGLLDSPYTMRGFAQHLQQRGFWTRAVLLPGHGTHPDDLLEISAEVWQTTVRQQVAALKTRVQAVYLVGFSLGGLLSLAHALEDSEIAGIVLLAPALGLKTKLAPFAHLHKLFSWAIPAAKWLNQAPENDSVRYQSCPFNGGIQVYNLIKQTRKHYKRLTCPVFLAISQEDETVCPKAALDFFKEGACPLSQMVLYSQQAKIVNDPRILVKPTQYPNLGIESFSHLAIPIAVDDARYGHNNSNTAKKMKTVSAMGRWYNKLLKKANLQLRAAERLTYNPDFERLLDDLDGWLDRLKKA